MDIFQMVRKVLMILKNPWFCQKFSESPQIFCWENNLWTLIFLQKPFRHTCFVATTIYAHFFVAKTIHSHFFCRKYFFAHFFVAKNDLRTLFCRKHDLRTCFDAKTIYENFVLSQKQCMRFFVAKTIHALPPESFCALRFCHPESTNICSFWNT